MTTGFVRLYVQTVYWLPSKRPQRIGKVQIDGPSGWYYIHEGVKILCQWCLGSLGLKRPIWSVMLVIFCIAVIIIVIIIIIIIIIIINCK